MRASSRSLVEKFNVIVERMLAALHQQRAIEARRVLGRYRHLLEAPDETLPLNKINLIRSEEEVPENANQSDAGERPADRPRLEHA